MIHTFGVRCASHKTVYLPDKCACGQAHGWTTDWCMPDCPEFDWEEELRVGEVEWMEREADRHVPRFREENQ